MARSSTDRPRPIGYGSRRLQWLTVVVGFLFFLTLLAEGTILVLRAKDSALTMPAAAAQGGAAPLWIAAATAAAVLLGGGSMLLGAACVGRYRFLAKVAGLLLFCGAGLRLAWPLLLDLFTREGTLASGKILGTPVLGTTTDGTAVPGALIPATMVDDLPLFAVAAAALLTFLGLVGLVITRPRRLNPDWGNERAVSEVFDDEPRTARLSDDRRHTPAPLADTGSAGGGSAAAGTGGAAGATASGAEPGGAPSTEEPSTMRITVDESPRTPVVAHSEDPRTAPMIPLDDEYPDAGASDGEVSDADSGSRRVDGDAPGSRGF